MSATEPGTVSLNSESIEIGSVALLAGTASIGTVGLNAGTNAIGSVTLGAALPPGTNQVGTVGLVAGAATIGNVGLVAGSAVIGALTANQSVNVALYNGVAPDLNAGAAGANTPRVVIATGGATPLPTGAAAAAQFPASLGQTTKAGSMSVTIASDNTVAVSLATLPALVAGSAIIGSAYTIDSGGTNKAGVNSAGQQLVNTEGQKATYSAAIVGLALATTPTDVFCVVGSNTKTIRVLRLSVSGTATAATAYDAVLIMRSTVDSGETNTSPTTVKHDSNNAAATAVVGAYTANPSVGTPIGTIRAAKGTLTTSAGAIPSVPVVFDFTTRNGQAVVLRGSSQGLWLNLNGGTLTGGAVDIDVEWTEE